jgi:iron complex outermembrane receptor protein
LSSTFKIAGYVEAPRVIDIDVWGVTPEFTYELNSDWRLLTTLHYSMSNSKSTGSGVNQTLQNTSIANGSLNPANVAAADPALVASILDQYDVKDTEQEMFYGRVIADGPLFTLPAGEVRVAVGAQYTDQSAELLAGDFTSTDRSGLQTSSNDRDITSVFAEVSVPVVESLTLSLSARYDDYSDFGDTTNPNVGFSWMPVEWLEIFGHWGESFNAPTPIDPLLPGFIRGYFPFAAFIVPDGGQRDPSRLDVLLAEGAGGALQPQTAEIWSLGFNMQPVDGLRINMNYFDIEFNDLLGSVNPQSAVAVQQNPDKFIFNPTQAQVDEFLSQMANGDQYAGLPAGPIGVLVDRRIGNTDQALLEGLDFGIEYSHQTSIGQMSYGLSGTKQLDFVTISNGNASDVLKYDTSDLNLVASLGWAREGMRGNLRVKYSAGFDSNPATGAANQTSVDDFVVADLHLALDVDDSLTFSVNVENLLDEEPPEWRLNQQPAYGFWTLGRVVKVGVSKTF